MSGRLNPRSDAGFTLVELLVAIAILGLITVPLANALIGILGNSGETNDRLELSHDGQISTAYFAQDVATVGARDYTATGNPPLRPSIQLNAAYDAGGAVCGDATTPAAVVRFLSDSWDGAATPPAVRTDIVAYYLTPTGLRRMKCAGSATPVSDVVIAHHVDPATPAVTCSTDCQAAAVPDHVTLRFTVTAPRADPYQITLNGQRRQT